jgi:hypothetical protein
MNATFVKVLNLSQSEPKNSSPISRLRASPAGNTMGENQPMKSGGISLILRSRTFIAL